MWKNDKLEAQMETVDAIKDYVIISGGLAWHIMSPPHEETKMIHDHKDVDLFIPPQWANTVIGILKGRGFNKYWTKYDGITPNFVRYGTSEIRKEDIDKPLEEQRSVKVLLDLFLEDIKSIEVKGYKLVEPKTLLGLYEYSHSSKNCVAVQAAIPLVARGINPVGKIDLIEGYKDMKVEIK